MNCLFDLKGKIIDQPQWLTNHKSEMLAHYTALIQQSGCKEYAEHRLKELEAGGLCKGITKRIMADIAKTAPHGMIKEKKP